MDQGRPIVAPAASLDLAAQDARDRILNIAATCPDAIMCATEDGRIIFWNRAAVRMFGHSEVVALQSRQDFILPDEIMAEYHAWLARIQSRAPGETFADHIELTYRRADGSTFPAEVTYSSWYESSGFVMCSMIRDITDRREAEERLRTLSHTDHLTRLANRTAFREHLNSIVKAEGNDAEHGCALLLVSLDRFKEVNNLFGFDTGDWVLRQLAKRLNLLQSETIHIARTGGDEFALIMKGNTPRPAAALAKGVRRAIRRPVRGGGQQVEVGASIGIALFPDHAQTVDDLTANADLAVRRAKTDGGNHIRFYIPALRAAAQSRRQTESELRRAFNRHELELFYQPQVSMADSTIVGAEALLRWRHPAQGLLAPGTFLPVLESSTLSSAVGN